VQGKGKGAHQKKQNHSWLVQNPFLALESPIECCYMNQMSNVTQGFAIQASSGLKMALESVWICSGFIEEEDHPHWS